MTHHRTPPSPGYRQYDRKPSGSPPGCASGRASPRPPPRRRDSWTRAPWPCPKQSQRCRKRGTRRRRRAHQRLLGGKGCWSCAGEMAGAGSQPCVNARRSSSTSADWGAMRPHMMLLWHDRTEKASGAFQLQTAVQCNHTQEEGIEIDVPLPGHLKRNDAS